MSLAGRIQIRGSTVTVKRATKTRSAGGASNLAWGAVNGLTGVKFLLDVPDTQTIQRLFGQEAKCDVRAICSADFDVRANDGVLVTAGWKAGTNYQVHAVAQFDQSQRARHHECALVSTSETFE